MSTTKKAALGAFLTALKPFAGQILGSVIPAVIGSRSAKKGREAQAEFNEEQLELARQQREDALRRLTELTTGTPEVLLDRARTSKELANRAFDLSGAAQDRALQAVIKASQTGDPRFATALPGAIETIGMSEDQRGSTLGQNLLAADDPIVQNALANRQMFTDLALSDLTGADEAFQASTASNLGLLADRTNQPAEILKILYSDPTFSSNFSNALQLGINELTSKDGGYIEKKAMGGVVGELLAEGDSFVTPGVEDHDQQEFEITDAKTGAVVAKSTGQERHEIGEDGITVTNSDQEKSMHDAFRKVSNPESPTMKELMAIFNAVKSVYSKPQFNPETEV